MVPAPWDARGFADMNTAQHLRPALALRPLRAQFAHSQCFRAAPQPCSQDPNPEPVASHLGCGAFSSPLVVASWDQLELLAES